MEIQHGMKTLIVVLMMDAYSMVPQSLGVPEPLVSKDVELTGHNHRLRKARKVRVHQWRKVRVQQIRFQQTVELKILKKSSVTSIT